MRKRFYYVDHTPFEDLPRLIPKGPDDSIWLEPIIVLKSLVNNRLILNNWKGTHGFSNTDDCELHRTKRMCRNREDLLSVARIAFLDYLASLAPAESEQAVQDLARFIGAAQNITVNQDTSTNQNKAANQDTYTNQDKTANVDGYESNLTVRRADKALYYGFASHYLDFDDAQQTWRSLPVLFYILLY